MAECCQDVTSLINRRLTSKRPQSAQLHWWLWGHGHQRAPNNSTLQQLAYFYQQPLPSRSCRQCQRSLPSHDVAGLKFNTVNMSITIPKEKLADIMQLIEGWGHKSCTTIDQLPTMLGKLFYMAQCCLQLLFLLSTEWLTPSQLAQSIAQFHFSTVTVLAEYYKLFTLKNYIYFHSVSPVEIFLYWVNNC